MRVPLVIIPVAGHLDCYSVARLGYGWKSSVSGGCRVENYNGFRLKLLVVFLANIAEGKYDILHIISHFFDVDSKTVGT